MINQFPSKQSREVSPYTTFLALEFLCRLVFQFPGKKLDKSICIDFTNFMLHCESILMEYSSFDDFYLKLENSNGTFLQKLNEEDFLKQIFLIREACLVELEVLIKDDVDEKFKHLLNESIYIKNLNRPLRSIINTKSVSKFCLTGNSFPLQYKIFFENLNDLGEEYKLSRKLISDHYDCSPKVAIVNLYLSSKNSWFLNPYNPFHIATFLDSKIFSEPTRNSNKARSIVQVLDMMQTVAKTSLKEKFRKLELNQFAPIDVAQFQKTIGHFSDLLYGNPLVNGWHFQLESSPLLYLDKDSKILNSSGPLSKLALLNTHQRLLTLIADITGELNRKLTLSNSKTAELMLNIQKHFLELQQSNRFSVRQFGTPSSAFYGFYTIDFELHSKDKFKDFGHLEIGTVQLVLVRISGFFWAPSQIAIAKLEKSLKNEYPNSRLTQLYSKIDLTSVQSKERKISLKQSENSQISIDTIYSETTNTSQSWLDLNNRFADIYTNCFFQINNILLEFIYNEMQKTVSRKPIFLNLGNGILSDLQESLPVPERFYFLGQREKINSNDFFVQLSLCLDLAFIFTLKNNEFALHRSPKRKIILAEWVDELKSNPIYRFTKEEQLKLEKLK